MNGDGAGTGESPMYPLPPPPMMAAQQQQPHRHVHAAANHHHHHQQQRPADNWAGNDANTLLVVATLITTLTYQLGTNVPGGYWQDRTQAAAGDADGKPPPHTAGDPVMRDLHPGRYWTFVVASWVGFAGSMLMTLSLLVRMPVDSRRVRWSFAVAYASLVLTFQLSQPKTHIALDILVWVAVTAFIWLMVSVRPEHRDRIVRFIGCAGDN